MQRQLSKVSHRKDSVGEVLDSGRSGPSRPDFRQIDHFAKSIRKRVHTTEWYNEENTRFSDNVASLAGPVR